jgi:hypothetical protein
VFAVERRGAAEYAVLAKAERAQGVRITVSVGDTFPFSNRAITRAFHAWSDPAEVDRLADRHVTRRTGGAVRRAASHTRVVTTRRVRSLRATMGGMRCAPTTIAVLLPQVVRGAEEAGFTDATYDASAPGPGERFAGPEADVVGQIAGGVSPAWVGGLAGVVTS